MAEVIEKPARIWFKRTKKGLRAEKLLVDLPSFLKDLYEHFIAEIVYNDKGLIKYGIVWDGKTAEVYVPSAVARELPSDDILAEIEAREELRIRFLLREYEAKALSEDLRTTEL